LTRHSKLLTSSSAANHNTSEYHPIKLLGSSTSNQYHSQEYFNAPLAQDDTNPLIYWKTDQFDFPILSAIANDDLTLEASSILLELIW
jgi:hypothetical protein